MGIIRNQSIKNSISFYVGMAIGAINTILVYPNVFKDQPDHWGLLCVTWILEERTKTWSKGSTRN